MSEQSLRHVVLFGFADAATESDIATVIRRFAALPELVSGIQAFEWGVNSSPEALNNGLTHCFMLTFGSVEARDDYLVHPDHVAFADFVGTRLEHVTVVDYWTASIPD